MRKVQLFSAANTYGQLMAERMSLFRNSWAHAEKISKRIIDNITEQMQQGKSALEVVAAYTREFDKWDATADNLEFLRGDNQDYHTDLWEEKAKELDPSVRLAIKEAANRIREFHIRQRSQLDHESAALLTNYGYSAGQTVRPLETVGIYVPGGRAAYPSTVLMNAIPAKVAGVRNVVMVCPTPDGWINPAVIAAAIEAGVDTIFKIGGAQAVAALAYGLLEVRRSYPFGNRVDKIVGPGNFYVQTAKQHLFGVVDIDMIAGPSEVLIIADDSANPEWVASDLLAQAEHDPLAASVLVTTSNELADKVIAEIEIQLAAISTANVAAASIHDFGMVVVVPNMQEALRVANTIGPEHLELCIENPDQHINGIQNAGAIFIGHYTPEAVGDYFAGPSHVLPTAGTARFASPLSVHDFLKRTSVIRYTEEALKRDAKHIIALAEAEGLPAHANSIRVRLNSEKG